jgi:hypothetical protein
MSLYSRAAVFASFFVRKSSAPTGTENALVVRNIPSGIQMVSLTEGTSGTIISVFSEVSAVASNATSPIITYTVPAGKTNFLTHIDMSGTNIATYDIIINSAEFARKRTYFGGDLSTILDCGSTGYLLNAGDILIVQVTNFRPTPGDFEARIQLTEP